MLDTQLQNLIKVSSYLYGVFVLFWGIGVAGAGYGWCCAWPFGIVALFTSPWTAYLGVRNPPPKRGSYIMLVTIFIVADILLVQATQAEGFHYLNKVLGGAIIWIALWIVPQLFIFWRFAAARTN